MEAARPPDPEQQNQEIQMLHLVSLSSQKLFFLCFGRTEIVRSFHCHAGAPDEACVYDKFVELSAGRAYDASHIPFGNSVQELADRDRFRCFAAAAQRGVWIEIQ